MRAGVSHNRAAIPHKINEAHGLAEYLEHLLIWPFPFGLCNGLKNGMGAPYNLIPKEPAISESKST